MSRARTRNSVFVLVMVLMLWSVMADAPAFVADRVAPVASAGPAHANPEGATFVGPMRDISREELNLLDIAEQTLERQCMERGGFKLWVAPKDAATQRRSFPYVVDDIDYAATHGYGGRQRLLEDQRARTDPNQRYFESLPADRKAAAAVAANGSRPVGLEAKLPNGMVVQHSDQGCSAEAQRELYGDLRAWYQAKKTAEALPGIRNGLVTGDPDLRSGLPAWSECMRARGLNYRAPDEIRVALPKPDQPGAHETEVRLAVAEATCAQQTGLAKTARELDLRYAARLGDQYRKDLDAMRRLQLTALPRAAAIVAGR